MTETLTVPLGERSYPIIIGAGVIESLGSELQQINFPKKIAIISNPTVDALYGDVVSSALLKCGYEILRYNVPDGEEFKSIESLCGIFDVLIQNKFDRGCGIIALGGGVVGDMAGFAAAILLRGIPYAQVPTTLLSQVDSSVGGKTAVNHPLGKNLIGAFYQPEIVMIDILSLKTLDAREVSAGLAEVVKYGIMFDYDFFCWLEDNREKLKSQDSGSLIFAIKTACQLKADIVSQDEKEGSVRSLLNYGHTFGHAVEKLAGYGQYKHGEAVSIGMVVAARLSHLAGLCANDEVQRIINLLRDLNLPVIPPSYSLGDYLELMQRDKKVRGGQLTMVLNVGIGRAQMKIVNDLPNQLEKVLSINEKGTL